MEMERVLWILGLWYSLNIYGNIEKFIRELYKICELIWRYLNPTISIGSILLLNVKEVKKDITDKTTSISNNILAPLAADYDGDVLNIIAIHDNYLKECFSILSPRNLIINKSGSFDKRFSFIKEQNLGIFLMNNK